MSENDLIVGGRLVKAGEEFDSSVLIENPNFQEVVSEQPQAQAPTAQPGVPPVQAAQTAGEQPASVAAPLPPVAPAAPAPVAPANLGVLN